MEDTRMTVQQCYQAMGSDYEDVMSRLRTDERVKKFLLKVSSDSSYAVRWSKRISPRLFGWRIR